MSERRLADKWKQKSSQNESVEKQLYECKQYAVEELFCCMYAPFFWEAVKIRYPEYVSYDHELYDLLGGAD